MALKAAKTAKGRKCKVCEHFEHAFLTALLEQGIAPRAIVKRVGGVTCKGLARYRDTCPRAVGGKEGRSG